MSVTRKSNAEDFVRWLERYEKALRRNLAEAAAQEAKDSLDHPGPQEPSRPGEPPNSQTGALHDGIEAVHDDMAQKSYVVSKRNGSNTVPLVMEYGTTDGRVAERPYMGPAYERTRDQLAAIVEKTKRENPL